MYWVNENQEIGIQWLNALTEIINGVIMTAGMFQNAWDVRGRKRGSEGGGYFSGSEGVGVGRGIPKGWEE